MSRLAARVAVVSSGLVILMAGLALAQPGTPRPGGGGRPPAVPDVPNLPSVPGQPGGPGGGGGGQGLVDRLMQFDANGDGKLSRDEVPAQFAERNFDRFDTNADGFVDRAELEAGAGNMRGGGGGAMGRMPMGRAMESMEEALKALQGSALNARSREGDLAQVQTLQEGALAAKFHAATITFPRDVLAHFGGDVAKARMEYREHMMEVLMGALELEAAIMEGDATLAREALAALEEMEHHGHDEFRRE